VTVVAGYDVDRMCKYPYEHNNPGVSFVRKSVRSLSAAEIAKRYPKNSVRILVGCAPCAPFSKYTQGITRSDRKWNLLSEFGRLVKELKPDVVSMENVPDLQRHSVFERFQDVLSTAGFYFTDDKSEQIVFCPDYGLPQHRSRLVIVASRLGPIGLIKPTHNEKNYSTVADAIRDLPPLVAGSVCSRDALHRTSRLSEKNLERIQHSTPGGSWRDWPPRLIAKCHKKKTGKSYPAVYGRMEWNAPAPTITTQFYGFGSGRFGHPVQDRAMSLREGALLQAFPPGYEFVEAGGNYCIRAVGRMIGNAVPVTIGEVVGRTIIEHLQTHGQ
jgi:DNA (cytosine-5)-methyltransferase 1